MQTATLAEIITRVLEKWWDMLSLRFQWKIPIKTSMKSREEQNDNHNNNNNKRNEYFALLFYTIKTYESAGYQAEDSFDIPH